MKQFVKTIAVIALTLGSASLAQAQKIGHIQLDSLISVMAESKTAQEVAQKHLKSLESELMTMQSEFEKKMNEFTTNRDKGTWTSLILEMKQKELEQMSQNIETYKASAQQDYQAKLASVSKPVYDKARKAIELVAKEGGYKYILDSSGGSLVYSEPGEDVFSAVKKKLETLPVAVIPGATSTGTTPVKTPTPGAGTKPAGGK